MSSDLKHDSVSSKAIIKVDDSGNKIEFYVPKSILLKSISNDWSFEEIIARIFIKNAKIRKKDDKKDDKKDNKKDNKKDFEYLCSQTILFGMCGDEKCMVSSLYKKFKKFIIKYWCNEEYDESLKVDLRIKVYLKKNKFYIDVTYEKDIIGESIKPPSIRTLYNTLKEKNYSSYIFDNSIVENILRNIFKKHLKKFGEIQRFP